MTVYQTEPTHDEQAQLTRLDSYLERQRAQRRHYQTESECLSWYERGEAIWLDLAGRQGLSTRELWLLNDLEQEMRRWGDHHCGGRCHFTGLRSLVESADMSERAVA